MDYVQEELARQRLALTLLMMGGAAKDFAEDMGAEVNTSLPPEKRRVQGELDTGAEDGESLWPWRKKPDGGHPGGMKDGVETERLAALRKESGGEWTAPLWKPEGGGDRPAGFSAEQVDTAVPFKGFGERQMEDGRTGMASAGDPAERSGKREHTPRDAETRERMVTEVLWTGPEGMRTAGPEELSRTFQRDARRYDGGFSLY